jgi:hypothetical protein
MRQVVAMLLMIVLSWNLIAQPKRPKGVREQIAGLPIGTKVDVRLKGGERVSGRLQARDQSGFTVEVGTGKAKTSRVVNFTDADKITAHPPTHTLTVAWIVTVAIVAAVVVVIAVILIERHNEGG